MSSLKDMIYDIEQLYIEGFSAKQIAEELNCPVGVVKGWIKGNGVADAPQEDASPFNTINS